MSNYMTRDEHLQWCKARALEYVEMGRLNEAMASMLSDMRKHPETKDHAGCRLLVEMKIAGHLNTRDAMRKFINGFN